MIAAPSLDGYAQSGIDYHYGWSCWLQFAEQKQGNGYAFVDQWVPNCIGNGQVHHVYQQIVNINPTNPDWRVDSKIDSTTILESPWNPFGSWGFTPWSAQLSGETTHDHSDIPGYMAAGYPPPVDYAQMHVQNYADDNWYDTCRRAALSTPPPDPRYSSRVLAWDH